MKNIKIEKATEGYFLTIGEKPVVNIDSTWAGDVSIDNTWAVTALELLTLSKMLNNMKTELEMGVESET